MADPEPLDLQDPPEPGFTYSQRHRWSWEGTYHVGHCESEYMHALTEEGIRRKLRRALEREIARQEKHARTRRQETL